MSQRRSSLLIPLALLLLSLPRPLAGAVGQALMTITPCRAVDTRNPVGPLGGPALAADETRIFTLTGTCSVPSDALGLAVNITVVSPAATGYAQLYAGDAAAPPTSVLSFSAGRTRAGNAIVALASDSSGTVALANVSAGAADFVIDITGFFVSTCPPPPPPVITPTPAQVCPGSAGNTASGPAATTWAWTITNGTITSATNIQTITYTAGASGNVSLDLTVTNAAGCEASNSVNVPINANPATPTITPTPAQVCAGSTTNTAGGPAGATTYAWSITNGTITSATNIQTITYTAGSSGNVGLTLVVATAAGCAASNSVNVPINATPATPTIAASNPQTFNVSGGSGTFTLTFNGQTTNSLAFNATAAQVQTELNALTSIGGVGGSAAVGQAGSVYTVTFGGTLTGPQPHLTAAGAGGCTVVVDPPAVCADSTLNQASGPAGATTYAWSITNGTITSATNVQTITYTAGSSGNVGLTLVVTNAAGCSASNSLNVAINPSPATPTITPTPATLCANVTGNTAAGPAGAATYAWSIANGTITSATNIQTITYTAGASGNVGLTLVVTNASGCSAQTSLNVPISPTPAFTPAAGALPVATFNVAYSLTFAGSVGTAPFTFALASGALPTGMTLNSNGTVSPNTPSATGPFAFSITITDDNGCSSTQAYTLNVQPKLTAKAYTDVGNTQLAGGVVAPSTPSVSVVAVSSGDTSDTTITYAVTVAPTHGALTTFNSNGTFLYTPNAGNTTSDAFTYTGTSNGVSATQTATIAFNGMVWYVDNTNGGTADGRSNTPFTTMTQANSAATSNGDFIYVFKGTGTTTGAYTMKTSQKLIGAGATMNVPTVGPLVTIAGVAGNTPTIGGTITLASSITVDGIDMSTGSSNGIAGTSVTGVSVTARSVASTTGTAVTIGGSGNTGTYSFTSVSANGAANGISLTNMTGSFTVTGDGGSSNNSSGGTIQNITGSGISLTNVQNTSLDQMNIQTTALSGIAGTQVANFTFTNGTINNSGAIAAPVDNRSNIGFGFQSALTENNVSGVVTITGNTLTNAYEHGIDIQNFAGTITNATISTNVLTSSTSSANTHGSAIRLLGFGSAGGVSNVTKATISGNTITNFPGGAGITSQYGNATGGPGGTWGTPNSATNLILIQGNFINGQSAANPVGANAILMTLTGAGQAAWKADGNGSVGNPISNIAGTEIGVTVRGVSSVASCDITNNRIQGIVSVNAQAIVFAADFLTATTDAPQLTGTVSGNVVAGQDGEGITALATPGSSAHVGVSILNNSVTAPNCGGCNRYGITAQVGTSSGTTTGSPSMCLKMSGNTAAGSGINTGIGIRKKTAAYVFNVDGFAGGGDPTAYITGNNPAGGGVTMISQTTGFGNCVGP